MRKTTRTQRSKLTTTAITDSAPTAAVAPTPSVVPEPVPTTGPKGKIGILVALLREADGTTIEAMMAATGWQAHSVRGALSGSVKKMLGYTVVSEKVGTTRIYRIVEGAGA